MAPAAARHVSREQWQPWAPIAEVATTGILAQSSSQAADDRDETRLLQQVDRIIAGLMQQGRRYAAPIDRRLCLLWA